MTYAHPTYTASSVAAQAELPSLNSDRLAFAGAYHGWGFHEDGCRSGSPPPRPWGRAGDADALAARPVVGARARGAPADPALRLRLRAPHDDVARRRGDPDAAFPRWLRRPGLDPRRGPLRRRRPPPAAAEGPRATSTSSSSTGRAHRVRVLANARVAGLRLRPADDVLLLRRRRATSRGSSPRCTTPTASGTATRSPRATPAARSVDKEFYVSPFFAVEGRYDIRARLTGDDVAVAISLTQGEETGVHRLGARAAPPRHPRPRPARRAPATRFPPSASPR